MADKTNLIQLIDAAADIFATGDRDALTTLFDQMSNILADCDGFGFEVIDTLWQACRQLQTILAKEPLPEAEARDAVYKQFLAVAALLKDSAPEPADSDEESAGEAYVIPADDVPLIDDFIVESCEHLESAEAAMLDLEADIENSDTLNRIFRAFHTVKGMAGFMNLTQIGQLTHNAENLLDLARKGEVTLSEVNADAVYQTIDMLKGMIDALRDAVATDCKVLPYGGVDQLSTLLQQCSEGAVPSPPPAEPVAEPAEPVSEPDRPEPAAAQEAPAAKPAKSSRKAHAVAEDTIKVKTTRLDNLINMIGELVIAQLMVMESLKTATADNEEELQRNITHQGKLIRELQELSMSMRMVPIGGIFQKMARMSRDLSRQAGKEINFVMQGEQTELDRTIVDKLADPLIHMIRNAVDHGLEDPDARRESGKPAAGRVELRAFHAAGNIVIELEDDGRGLNREKLLEKGIRSGLFSADSTPSDQDIFNVIFMPGLSTAEKITKVSGRGVGMDVVRRNIESLRGRIDISSTPGKGTLFTITLPLTLAIIDGQIIRIGNEKFIIPINVIRKSFRPEAAHISTVQNRKEMVMDRDELLRLVRLHEMFEIEPDSTEPTEGLVVVVEQDTQACGLLVDDLLDQQQVVIKNLGSILTQTQGIAGGAIMGNGQVSLILDIPGIIKLFQA